MINVKNITTMYNASICIYCIWNNIRSVTSKTIKRLLEADFVFDIESRKINVEIIIDGHETFGTDKHGSGRGKGQRKKEKREEKINYL